MRYIISLKFRKDYLVRSLLIRYSKVLLRTWMEMKKMEKKVEVIFKRYILILKYSNDLLREDNLKVI